MVQSVKNSWRDQALAGNEIMTQRNHRDPWVVPYYESPLGARSFMRHPCNAKQSGKSQNFTWLFSHALVTIVHSYFSSSSYPYTFSTTRSSSVCPHSPFICWGEPFFVLNHLLYYFSTNINLFTVHYLVARCGILPVPFRLIPVPFVPVSLFIQVEVSLFSS